MTDEFLFNVPSTWKITTLGEACAHGGGGIQTGPFGSELHASDYVPIGVPSVMPQHIGDNVIRDENIARITSVDARRLSKYLLREGDIVYSRRGDVGRRALVNAQQEGWLCGTGCLRVRPNTGVNSRFLTYFLGHPEIRDWIFRHAVGATMPNLNTQILGAVPLALPTPGEQKAIAAALGALDDKITVNERIAAVCSRLSRELMRAMWESSPVDSLVDSLEVLDADWTRTTLGELCRDGGGSIQTGPFGSQLHAADYVDEGVPSVMPQNIGDNAISEKAIARISENDANRLSKYLLKEGDIVYSRRGDVRRRSLIRARESGWLCGTGCLRVRSGDSIDPLFLSHYLSEPEIQDWIVRHAVGATMPNLNTKILGDVPVVIPPQAVRNEMSRTLTPLDESATASLREVRIISTLRDTLLPHLVSGRLRVKDAEKIIEDHV
ncbi:restriction endonuclease subunit S [Nocardia sp. NPDC004415]